MMMTPGRMTIPPRRFLAASLMIFCLAGIRAAVAQQPQDEDATRHLWDTAFIKQGNKKTPRRAVKRSYRVVTPRVPVTNVAADSVIGVTLWRLRPTRGTDAGERIIDHDAEDSVAWLPERVSSGGRLSEGDRIRISIEAARTGYLYVVDQEVYADGTKGEPHLIFPTTRTREGDNSVKAGRLIEIPAQDDSPPFFTLRRTRTDHIGENMIILVTPTPIEGLKITEKAQRISDEMLAAWEKSWGAESGRLEMANGSGKAWTKQEKEAGADATRSLTDNEPAPQTIYYRPGGSSSSPVLVKVELQYARTRSGNRK